MSDLDVKHRHKWHAPFDTEWCAEGDHFAFSTRDPVTRQSVCRKHPTQEIHVVRARECDCRAAQVYNDTSGEWETVDA